MFRVGDRVKKRNGQIFEIKIISHCQYIDHPDCRPMECPGRINGHCFGNADGLLIEQAGCPNSGIIIKEEE